MKRLVLITVIFASVLSCTKEQFSPIDNELGRFELDEDTRKLEKRMEIYNTPVYFNGKNASAAFTHVATVLPPSISGSTVGATSIAKQGNYVYVSYNTTGEDYGGAIDVIDVSNPSSPSLVSQLKTVDTDFHEVYPESNHLFYAGQRSVASSGYADTNGHSGAIAGRFKLAGGLLTTSNVEEPFKGYAINSITRHGGETHMISGNRNGGILLTNWGFDFTSNPKQQVYFDGGQFLARDQSNFVALQGEPGKDTKVWYYDYHNTDPADAQKFTLPYEVTELDRNGIAVKGTEAFLAMGEDGLIALNLNNGQHQQYYYSDKDIAKGVAVSNKYLFVANGNDGLIIADRKSANYPQIGQYDIDEDANDVVYDPSGWVFIAQGNGGLRVLKEN